MIPHVGRVRPGNPRHIPREAVLELGWAGFTDRQIVAELGEVRGSSFTVGAVKRVIRVARRAGDARAARRR